MHGEASIDKNVGVLTLLHYAVLNDHHLHPEEIGAEAGYSRKAYRGFESVWHAELACMVRLGIQ